MHKWRIRANSSKTDLLLFNGTCPIPKLPGAQITYTKQTKVLSIIVDNKLKFGPQLKVSQQTLSSKLNMIKPHIFSGLKINTSLRILKTVLIPKTAYLAHLWDTSHKLSLYTSLKTILNAPVYSAAKCLHAFSNIPPIELTYTY